MCIAVPMEVVSIDGDGKAGRVSLAGNEITVNLRLVKPEIGDYVLVHAGCAIEIIQREQAHEILEIFKDLADI